MTLLGRAFFYLVNPGGLVAPPCPPKPGGVELPPNPGGETMGGRAGGGGSGRGGGAAGCIVGRYTGGGTSQIHGVMFSLVSQ